MNKSETAELAWAALDARAIAKLLDRLTADESGLSPHELCLARAYAWALVEGLQSMLARLPKAWASDPGLAKAPASDATGPRGGEPPLETHAP